MSKISFRLLSLIALFGSFPFTIGAQDVSEERRELTRKRCDLYGKVADLTMSMRLNGESLDRALEIVRSADSTELVKISETLVLDAYSFPIHSKESATEEFRILTMQMCFVRAEIEGKY